MGDPWLPVAGCLLDNSAWARSSQPAIATRFDGLVAAQRLVACEAFLLEALYSARTGDELRRMRRVLTRGLRQVRCDDRTWDVALEAQQTMADTAGLMHRRKPMDLLIAATAHQHGLGVLHYDRDYDLIAEHSGLDFASVWIAEPGSI